MRREIFLMKICPIERSPYMSYIKNDNKNQKPDRREAGLSDLWKKRWCKECKDDSNNKWQEKKDAIIDRTIEKPFFHKELSFYSSYICVLYWEIWYYFFYKLLCIETLIVRKIAYKNIDCYIRLFWKCMDTKMRLWK